MAKLICEDCERVLKEDDIDDDGMSTCCWATPVKPSKNNIDLFEDEDENT